MTDATRILSQIEQGDPSAAEQLLPLVYDELRRLASQRMSHENAGHTLQATALVHEAYIRLVDVSKVQRWNSRGHFFGAAAESMRRILVEQARRKGNWKSGGRMNRIELSNLDLEGSVPPIDMLALDEAISRLESVDARAAQVVMLRFFAGLTGKQTAEALGVSTGTVELDWAYARSWLRIQLS